MAGEQQQPTPEQMIAQLSQRIEAGFAAQNAALAQVVRAQQAQQQAAAAPAAQRPQVSPSDLERVNLRVLDELGRDPVRVFGEVRSAAVQQAKEEMRQEWSQYEQQRQVQESGRRMSEQILAANPQLRGHEHLLANAIQHYQTTAPHLSRDEQIGYAIQAAKQQVDAWEQAVVERRLAAQRQTAQAGYPAPGAFAEPGAPEAMNETEARRQRLSVIMGGRDAALQSVRRANVG